MFVILLALLFSLPSYSFLQSIPGFYQRSQGAQLAPGVDWERLEYNDLFGAKQVVNVVTVDLQQASVSPIQQSGCHRVSDMAQRAQALVAVNGTFFNSSCESRNFFKKNGKVESFNIIRDSGAAALLIDKQGEVSIRMIDKDEDPAEAVQGIGGFPLLASEGQVQLAPLESTGFFSSRHPRTAVAVLSKSRLLIVTVDGRSQQSRGLNLRDLSEFLVNMGARSAMNLDGGGSTVMWTEALGLVSRPSDSGGERRVTDALAVF